jgi:hypothetical protein
MLGAAVVITALAGAVAGGAVANAAANDSEDPGSTTSGATEFESTQADAVVLPTGDTVHLSPGGGVEVVPAPGREDVGFVGQTASGGSGDVVVVPVDMLGSIRSGEADPRRYNISRLLADGHTDAGAVSESELDSREYAGLVPVEEEAAASSAEAQELTVSVKDRSGGTPDQALVAWVRADTGEVGDIEIGEDGTGTVGLEPGEYLVSTTLLNGATETERGATVYGFTSVTVGKEPAKLEVDAAAAAPVTAEVEREGAVLEDHLLYLEATYPGGNLGAFEFMDIDTDAFVLPQPETAEYGFNFIYQPVLSGSEDGAEPYTYTLAFGEAGSIPADPAYTVADDDLAQEETDYQDLGVDVQGRQCDYPRAWEDQFLLFAQCSDRAFPSQVTNLLTAAPVQWDRTIEAGLFDEDKLLTDGYFTDQLAAELQPGPVERVIGDGPLAAGTPSVGRVGDQFLGGVTPVASHAGETLRMVGYESGNVTLSRDGEWIGSTDSLSDFSFKVPAGDEGRYTLTAEATRGTAVTPLAVSSTAAWEFDSATVEEAALDLPVVIVKSDGVQNGRADRDEPLELDLSLSSMGQKAETIGLEVSYDDGATWTAAEIECDTAVLEHPEGAEYASLRLTATDTAGTVVTQTTIRSFGLR